RSSNGASVSSTSVSGRQVNRRPMTFGCKVRTNTATRHSGMPQATSRSDNCANTCCGCGADRAPSISQSKVSLIPEVRIALELIAFLSRLILPVQREEEERHGDRADPAAPD